MSYIGKSPTGTGIRSRYYYTATGGETSISGADDSGAILTFTDGAYVDVYLNGVLLVAGTDYNTSTANTISSLAALAGSDIVEVLVYDIFTVADIVKASSGGTFNGGVTINGDLTVDTNTLYVDSTNNRVGIGTSSASQSLHVVGEGLFEKVSADSVVSLNSTGGSGRSYQIRSQTSGDFYIYDNTAGAARVTIDSVGKVGIGTTSPLGKFMVKDGTSSPSALVVRQTSEAGAAALSLDSIFNNVSNTDKEVASIKLGVITNGSASPNADIRFETVSSGTLSERMRIESSGKLLLGTTSVTSGILNAVYSGTYGIDLRGGSGASTLQLFFAGATNVGSISTNGTSTAFNTSSDYRLKENVVADWDATTRLKQLNPVRFNFIADADTTVDGFLAHEVQSVVPEAITGTHNEVDDEGNPVYQGIDQSKLVPLLVKTIQELEARIAALEAN